MGGGRLLLAAVLLAGPLSAGTLTVRAGDEVIADADLPEGGTWCLEWNHSVTGGRVADCFGIRDGRMVLETSYLHDYAAGLGEVAGRGTVRPDPDGGYWIEGIDEIVDPLVLRVGRPTTDHRMILGTRVIGLSELAPGARIEIGWTD